MNKFLAKNKVNLEKMFLVIFLYIYMITFLAYILTDHFYSYGFNIGVLYSALLLLLHGGSADLDGIFLLHISG